MPVDQILDTEQIRRQLERILSSPVFKSSRRTSLLLAYIVERALEGQTDLLKERLLGIEVFGRSSGYDTASDHIVRSTAGEIRKRLAQYYLQPDCEGELRIELLPGSYVPQFRVPESKHADPATASQAAPLTHEFIPRRSPLRRYLPHVAVLFACLVFLAWGVSHTLYVRNPVERFWAPLLKSWAPIAICVGDPNTSWNGSETGAFRGFTSSGFVQPATPVTPPSVWFRRGLPLGDALTAARVFALIGANAGEQRIVYGPESTLSDLRQNSAVLIGGIDNFWTMNLTRELRYRFQLDSTAKTIFIQDGRDPARRDWQVAVDLPRNAVSIDYAIIARVIHPATGRPIVIAGGIRDCGTIAAGEFLTSPACLAELERHASAHWNNVEAVLSTEVFKGTPGPPHLVAAYFW